jgi:CDP-6-deoxy-D-xylo-4-hexulose-3-dehydrase
MSLLPLATETWDDAERRAIERVTASGRFTMGEEVKTFERQFAEHFGSRHAVMVNSGSSANLIMMAGLLYHPDRRLERGCEVIVPAVSWSTTYYPVHQMGMTLRFVDVDMDTLNLTVETVERAITPKTKAVLAVNLLGNPCELTRLRELCDTRGLVLIEDNCESMGAELDGRQAGTFGACGSFSTFFSHHISTMEGGVIATDDEDLAHVMISLRAHGWLREQPPHSRLNVDIDPFMRLFRFVLPGYNVRPLEMSGAIGQDQLRKLPGLVAARRENAAAFQRLFADLDGVRIQAETGKSSWFGFSLILEGPLKGRRAEVVKALAEARIDTRPIVTGNFLNNPVIELLDHNAFGEMTNADRIDQDGLFIGNHHYPIAEPLAQLREIMGGMAGGARAR